MSSGSGESHGRTRQGRAPTGRAEAEIDASTPAVVLKFDQNVLHHGGLGVIRSLGRLGVPVYGVHEDRFAPAAASRYLQGRYIWQPPAADADRVLAGLTGLAERIGRPAVLIPTDDAGAIFLAEYGAALRPLFLFPDPPADLPRRLAGKDTLGELCGQYGVACPVAAVPGSLAQARDFASAVGFPLVAKLTMPWRADNQGLRSTTVVTSPARLEQVYVAGERAAAGLMLQEFVPGSPGSDWFFHGYFDSGSACRPGFTGTKMRAYPAGAGLTSLGLSAPNDRLRADMSELAARLGYRGIVDLDLRWDERDQQFKLLDFNPRIGAQFMLFRDSAGMDVVRACYLDLTGQPVPAGDQLNGRSFVVENYDPLAAVSYWRRGDLGPGEWLRSMRAVKEVAWFSRDDLRPFGLMCLRMAGRGPAHLARIRAAGFRAGRPLAARRPRRTAEQALT